MISPILTSFVKVAQYGSFSKAAENSYISSNAIMKQMNQLEQQVNTQLFIRSNHGVQLSEAGQSLYRDVQFMIRYADKAVERARQAVTPDTLIIRVGDSLLNPCSIMLDVWRRVCAVSPEFRMELVPFMDNGSAQAITPHTIGSDFDILSGAYDTENCAPVFNVLELGESKRCVAVPKSHPLSSKKEIAISDLYGERLLVIRRGTSHIVDRIHNDLSNHHPEIQLEHGPTYYDINAFNYCERTGCLLLTMDIWASVHPALVTIPVAWEYSTKIGIKYPLQPSESVQRFIDRARRILQDG